MMRFLRLSLLLSLIITVSAATFDLADTDLVYVAGSNAVTLDVDASLAGADFSSGSPLRITMTITSGLVAGEDLLQIRAAGVISVASGVVSVSNTPIGSYSGGAGGTALVINITTGSNATLVQTLIRALAYHNIADSGASATNRVVRIAVADKNGSVNDQRTVAVSAGNAAPTLDIGGTLVVPRTARLAIGPAILLATDDDDSTDELRYQLGTLPQRGTLLLTGIDSNGDLTTTVVLGGSLTEFTQADIDAGRLRYDHLGGPETTDSFTLRVRDSDGAATPLTALNISITGTTTNPVITLPSSTLTCIEQGAAVAMDPAAPGTLGVAISDADSLHYRRGELVVQLVDSNGDAAGTAGDTIGLRMANGQMPSPSQTGYICVVGSSIYIRHTASSDPLPTTGSNTSPDQLLGTIDASANGVAGAPLSITFASTVVRTESHQAAPLGDRITSESDVVTPIAVAQLIANLQLSHPGDDPSAAPRFIEVALSEAAPNAALGSVQRAISITPVNDRPVFTVAGPLNMTAVVGRPTIVTLLANDPDLPSGASLVYRLVTPVAGVVLDAASGAVTWSPPDTTPANLALIAQDDQGSDSLSLLLTITPLPGPTADAPYIVSDPLVELGDDELIFHPFTIVPPAAGALSVDVQVVGDAPSGMVVDPVSLDELSWTLTAPSVSRPADGIYTFGLRVEVTTLSGTKIGYQPITLVVLGVSGSN